ncbi:hypothetical protein BKA08_000413 [Nocardioides marinisabuli]|uniref:Uncharacterized protein n=1 Tax=Nocardioides marinisabuli TaxID=419476 RepID=A0A7Y9EY96_9ACTN|nr:hypothetical protein [Nocardioides marinisabuli]NYD56175.1 hypothetical protein [Nocardioides marinisabuli]
MSALGLGLVDSSAVLVPRTDGTEGALIDDLRDSCGFVIQGIDWVCRQFGFDLVQAIFDPIAGDYDAVDAMTANWAVLGEGLGAIGQNFAAISGALPEVWGGAAADAAGLRVADAAQAWDTAAEGTSLISAAMQDMLVATKAAVEVVAEMLSMIDDVVLKVAASALGWAKEIATGGASCRKVISLVNRAIEVVRRLETIIPPLLQACAMMARMMKAVRALFQLTSAATSTYNGARADDVAQAAY